MSKLNIDYDDEDGKTTTIQISKNNNIDYNIITNIENKQKIKDEIKFIPKQERNKTTATQNQTDNNVFLSNKRLFNNQIDVCSKEEVIKIKENYFKKHEQINKVDKISNGERLKRIKNESIFKFDWNPNEDTTIDNIPLIENFDPIEIYQKYNKSMDFKEKEDDYNRKYIKNEKLNSVYSNSNYNINNNEGNDSSFKPITEMTDRDWKIFREDNNILIKSNFSSVPNPIRNWKEANLNKELYNILKNSFPNPTPIQKQSIPIGLEKKDLIGISPTGSGKTISFLVPLVSFLLEISESEGNVLKNKKEKTLLSYADEPLALILAPTRELAQQIDDEFFYLTKKLSITLKSVCLVGQKSIEDQYMKISKGVNLVVGTPGRIKDCLERLYLSLRSCQYIIIDEADKILESGFEIDLKYILDCVITDQTLNNSRKITQMFSATMPKSLETIAKTYLKHPCFIEIQKEENIENINQLFFNVSSTNNKFEKMKYILKEYLPSIIIFVNSKYSTSEVYKFCIRNNHRTCEIHGDKSQDQRESLLKDFKKGVYDILVCTSLVGRGIDFSNIQLVINFEAPNSVEEYEHRIGRTGRAGKKGVSITFISEKDKVFASELINLFDKRKKNIPEELLSVSTYGVIYAE